MRVTDAERFRYRSSTILLLLSLALLATGCSIGAAAPAGSGTMQIVVAENFWASIVRQEIGMRAQVTAIITNPNADPHAYEPTVMDARRFAGASYVVLNGAGYDSWGQKLLDANPVTGRRVLVVSDLLSASAGGNPHFWYGPSNVTRVAAAITADLKRLSPHDAAYFDSQHSAFVQQALRSYRHEIAQIAQRYRGVSVGATESIFVPLAQALGLRLITPPDFMKSLSEGAEPTAQDRATFERQIRDRAIEVLVFNSQNATPDTDLLETLARSRRIPIVSITETLAPASASFQSWQVRQLSALAHALSQATGR